MRNGIGHVILVSALLSAAAIPGASVAPAEAADASLVSAACSLPRVWLVRTVRGYRPDRSGEIQLLPREPNVLGSGLPHAGPWETLQRVPMFWYGPGHIRPAGIVERPVTSAGIVPTQADLLEFPFRGAAGQPMSEAVVSDGPAGPPRLLVTMVWDAGGRDVLDEYPSDWPYLRSLIPAGTWYEHATAGSSPSQTAQVHATIGTGTYPDQHGLVGHRLRIGHGVLAPWSENPGYLVRPTLADLYDRSMSNRPVVGEVAALSIQLGMLGHGAMWGGGDRDIAVVRIRPDPKTLGDEADSWTISEALAPFYRLPGYVNDVPGLARAADELDRMDGERDGLWRDNSIEQLRDGYDTPARIPYETRVIEEVIRREGFGADRTPDLLFINYKMIDYISHAWSMNSPEMRDAVRLHDVWLERFFDYLDQQVGEGRWALVLTADHGATPSLQVSGGFEISTSRVEAVLQERFDADGDDVRVIQHASHTQMYVNTVEMRQHGHSLEEISRAIMALTKAETAGGGADVSDGEAEETVFQAAYPSSLLAELPCLRAGA